MKLKMILMAMALFAMASVSQAQFNAILINLTPLTENCDGGAPLSHGCMAGIYWDSNNNGPDVLDALAPMGNGFGQANFNQIDMGTGEDLLGLPGGFATDPAFTIGTTTPAPSRYYVVVECGTAKWTSAVFTISNGLNEIEVGGWTCVTTVTPCDEPTEINIETVGGRNFLPDGATYTNCFDVCANTLVTICLGPLAADERPVSSFHACQGGTPAEFMVDPNGWQYNTANATWCLALSAITEGCICFQLDDILAAEHGSFDAVAGDRSVSLSWNTLSESNVASFTVLRKIAGHENYDMIGSVEALNAAGATYTFVDANATNGTTYEYTLETVNLNGSSEAWGVVASATPSMGAAVITEYALHQNYPNPFNPSTNLVFDVVSENNVNLTVYNAMGQEVATVVNGVVNAGRHSVSFDASNLTSGLYFYTVKIGNEFTATKKMLLVK
jgi:hypothetical protein